MIPTAGCAQCARWSLLTFVRASALGDIFLRSYVRDSDVRTCVTGCVRIYGVSDVARMISLKSIAILCALHFVHRFVQSLQFWAVCLFFHDKFLTILASIVGYEPENTVIDISYKL